jgi:osmotically-inducible protein OsmY
MDTTSSASTMDSRTRDDVTAALAADERLTYPAEDAVSASDGTVTLRGTVGSFAQRSAPAGLARRTAGVIGVMNKIAVREARSP